MRLKPEQQKVCQLNFEAIKRRLSETTHRFRHDALRNAVECMIIDFFDFHAALYGADKISSQQHQLMEQFFDKQSDQRSSASVCWSGATTPGTATSATMPTNSVSRRSISPRSARR